MSDATISTLIIEDNPGDVLLLKEQLTQAGWPVSNSHHAEKLEDAIASLHSIQPSIVLLDLNLPDSSGLETFLSLHAIAPETPVIILTGENDSVLSLQAIQAGAQDFWVKGEFEVKILKKTILYGIERKKNQLKIEEANIRFELASKATNDPLWDLNCKSNEISWNDKVAVFGYTDTVFKDQVWRMSAIHKDDQEIVRKSLADCMSSDMNKWSCQYRFICADGAIKFILDRAYIVRDRFNKPYRMIGTMQDITDKIREQTVLEENRKMQQRALLKAHIDGQEKERDHISHELHDNVNQILTGAKIQLKLVKVDQPEQAATTIAACVKYLEQAIGEIRQLASRMSPVLMKDIGLVTSISLLTDEINAYNVLKVGFEYNFENDLLPQEVSLSLYRITQEHLTNVIKHAKATHAMITLEHVDDVIRLNISDDGIGADLTQKNQAKGIGLLNISNRVQSFNGKLEISSAVDQGFHLWVEIPVKQD